MNIKKLIRGLIIITFMLLLVGCNAKISNNESINSNITKNSDEDMNNNEDLINNEDTDKNEDIDNNEDTDKNEDIDNNEDIHKNETINSDGTKVSEIQNTSEEVNSQNPVNTTEKKEAATSFPANLYASANTYGVAPSEVSNKDMERPEDNREWIKTLSIRYPQMYNLEDDEKEKRINDMLYKEAAYYHDVLENRDYIDYNVDYRIMKAEDDLISILFLGEVTDPKTANRFAHAVTIDIKSEKPLELKEFLKVNKSFVKNHLYTDFKIVENNFDDMAENTPFVEDFVKNYGQSVHTKDYYIKGSEIGIIIPTYNNMGYILIEGSEGKRYY